jgi:hypothetical protein
MAQRPPSPAAQVVPERSEGTTWAVRRMALFELGDHAAAAM